MVSSPPPSGAATAQGQLLHELETLSNALYKSQQPPRPARQSHSAHASTTTIAAAPKKNIVSSFLSRRASSQEPKPSSGDGNQGTRRASPFTLASRHSFQEPQPPLSQRTDESAFKQRFSTSAAALESEKVDIRSRYNRRPALQPWHSQDTVVEEEESYIDDSPDSFNLNLEIPLEKKKKSIWNWKPLRALTHIGRQRFVCIFSAHVRLIEGIPAGMNGLRLTVHIRKKETKEGAVQTVPSRVFQGVAEFNEILYLKCSVYGTKNPSQSMKFMSRDVILSVIAPDVDELDLGKHQLDISRLLVDPVDDRRGEIGKRTSWSTSFGLSGKAKGAKVFVTFNYEFVDKDSTISGNLDSRFTGSPTHHTMRTSYSLPNSAHVTPRGLMGRKAISPSISEPGSDMVDVLALDRLSLDEPHSTEIMRGIDSRIQGFSYIRQQDKSKNPGQQVFTVLPRLERNSPQEVAGYKAEYRNSNDSEARRSIDHGSSFEPKLTMLAQKDLDSEQKPRHSTPDPALAPSTPRQSHDSSDFTREKNLSRQISEKTAISDEETEFEVVEQGVEKDESKNLSSIETKLGEVREAGEEGKNTSEAEINETKESTNASFQTTNMPDCKDGHIPSHSHLLASDLSKKDSNSLQTQSNTSQSQVMNETKRENKSAKEAVTTQMILRTLETLLQGTTAIERSHMDAIEDKTEPADKEEIDISEPSAQKKPSSTDRDKEVNLDNEADLVTGEFLNMLGVGSGTLGSSSDSEPDSPRAKLLKQFEKEALREGGIGMDLTLPDMPAFKLDDVPFETSTRIPNTVSENATNFVKNSDSVWDNDDDDDDDDDDDKELESIVMVAESELNRAAQSIRSKTRAKLLEDAETEALMQEWGLNEKAFTNSPPKNEHGAEESISASFSDRPAFAKGLAPIVPLKDGGFLSTMNTVHFQPCKNDVNMVMQVSRPVVVPTDMGSSAIDVLRSMAAMGMESMATQAMATMPLEDVTGKNLDQFAREGFEAREVLKNDYTALTSGHNSMGLSTTNKFGAQISQRMNNEFFSLHDLTPMAMHQIEALAIEGLKIQADMTDDDAPYALNAFSLADIISSSTSRGGENESDVRFLKGVAGMPLYQAEGSPDGSDKAIGTNGLMSMAITLDEWMHLDAELDDCSETDKKASKVMAAHQAVHSDHWKRSRTDARLGCMGNALTIAVLVQLRDPVRNYEAVGCPMIALVQAERVMSPPKVRLGGTVPLKGKIEEEEETDRGQFKITGVHLAGLKSSENEKKEGWGDQRQQQSGSRWLVAHGMTKTRKNHPLLKSTPGSVFTSAKTKSLYSDSVWSISARSYGNGSRWKEVEKPNSHVRNPDVVFANRSLRRR